MTRDGRIAEATGDPLVEAVHALPSGAASVHVRAYHAYRQDGVAPTVHRGLPSPSLTLIFTVHDPLVIAQHVDHARAPGAFDAILGGLHTAPALVEHGGRQSGIQVQVDPLSARALFGLPAGELAGLDDDAVLVMGSRATIAQRRIADARSWRERFAVLDGLLQGADDAPAPPPEVVRAWRLLLRTGGRVPITRLARDVGWSERHLSSRFRTEIGVTPKAAGRVIRFDRARRDLQDQALRGRVRVADIAACHGYYDQAHLVRDFTQFTGLSPTAFLTAEFANFQAAEPVAVEGWAS